VTTTPRDAAREAQDSPVFEILARIGYIVLGIVHIVIGVITISTVTGGGGEADPGGALEKIRDTPIGVLLLWVIAIGLLALAIWQITEAVLERSPDPKKKWGYRLKYVGTAVVYLAIAWTALVYAFGGESDSSEASQSLSAQLLSTPAGGFVLGLIGLVVGGVGVAFIIRGVTRGFKKHLALPDEPVQTGIVTFGVVGYVAKGIAVTIAGALFVIAAVTHNPERAGWLDGALDALGTLPFGDVLLWVVGTGLATYGLFCFARSRYAKM